MLLEIKDLAKGPMNISGVGNYVINVKSANDSKIFHSMIMMDTHSLGSYSTIDSVNIGSEKINLTGLNESEKLKLNEWITKDGYIFAQKMKIIMDILLLEQDMTTLKKTKYIGMNIW